MCVCSIYRCNRYVHCRYPQYEKGTIEKLQDMYDTEMNGDIYIYIYISDEYVHVQYQIVLECANEYVQQVHAQKKVGICRLRWQTE